MHPADIEAAVEKLLDQAAYLRGQELHLFLDRMGADLARKFPSLYAQRSLPATRGRRGGQEYVVLRIGQQWAAARGKARFAKVIGLFDSEGAAEQWIVARLDLPDRVLAYKWQRQLQPA